jgi:hypothetical protein
MESLLRDDRQVDRPAPPSLLASLRKAEQLERDFINPNFKLSTLVVNLAAAVDRQRRP